MRVFIVLMLLLVPLTSRAVSGRNMVSRGGFGLLFPDQSSTRNTGELARTSAVAMELSGGKFTGTHEMNLAFSSAFSNGTIALAGFVTRYGKDPFYPTQREDAWGASIGFAPGSLAFSLGTEKEEDIHQTIARVPTLRVIKATASFSGAGPLVVGVSAKTTLERPGSQEQIFEFGLGLKGSSAAIESVTALSTVSTNWASSLFVKWQGQMMYATAGGSYLGSAEAVQILARAGFVWGVWDASAYVTHIIKHAENPFSGLALRVVF